MFLILTQNQAQDILDFTNGNNRLNPVPLHDIESRYFLSADCKTEQAGIYAAYFNNFPWLIDTEAAEALPE